MKEKGDISTWEFGHAWSFSGTRALTQLELPQSLRLISHFAFLDSPALSSIVLPAKLEIIEEMAFAKCRNLSGPIVIPESVNLVGTKAFDESPLSMVFLPNCDVDIHRDSFPATPCIGVPIRCQTHFTSLLGNRVNGRCPAWPTSPKRNYFGLTLVTVILLGIVLRIGLDLFNFPSDELAIPLIPKKLRKRK
jgi:hypothetical protein